MNPIKSIFRQAERGEERYSQTMNRFQREAVDKMQEFLILHYLEDITINDVLRVSNYSPFHAQRLFAEATGYGVGEYLRKLRLTRSAERLKNGESDVTDQAFESGYESVEGFIRAFRKEFGTSAGEYKRSPSPICFFYPLPFEIQGFQIKRGKENGGNKKHFCYKNHQTQEKGNDQKRRQGRGVLGLLHGSGM